VPIASTSIIPCIRSRLAYRADAPLGMTKHKRLSASLTLPIGSLWWESS
jgi:hypothetical protein